MPKNYDAIVFTKLNAAIVALEKIAEAERMGYGTQRTYGEMAIQALEKLK